MTVYVDLFSVQYDRLRHLIGTICFRQAGNTFRDYSFISYGTLCFEHCSAAMYIYGFFQCLPGPSREFGKGAPHL